MSWKQSSVLIVVEFYAMLWSVLCHRWRSLLRTNWRWM